MKSAIAMFYLIGFASLGMILKDGVNLDRFSYTNCRYFGASVNDGKPVWICNDGRLRK